MIISTVTVKRSVGILLTFFSMPFKENIKILKFAFLATLATTTILTMQQISLYHSHEALTNLHPASIPTTPQPQALLIFHLHLPRSSRAASLRLPRSPSRDGNWNRFRPSIVIPERDVMLHSCWAMAYCYLLFFVQTPRAFLSFDVCT